MARDESHDTEAAPPSEPRIPPLSIDAANPEQSELLEPLGGDEGLNLFRTLAHNPKLTKSWLRFAGRLLQRSSLPEADRELVILRVALRCGSGYEWGQHVGIARAAGLGDDQIAGVASSPRSGSSGSGSPGSGSSVSETSAQQGPDDPAGSDMALDHHQRTLLAAVDQLLDDHVIDEATWVALEQAYDAAQMIEFTMLAGHYAMLAGTLNSIGVRTEGPLPGVGELR